MVDLLRRDIVYGCASRHSSDVRRIPGRVAADVTNGGILDALFALRVLRHARDGPITRFGFAIDDKARERI
jgi:hypothetical protein